MISCVHITTCLNNGSVFVNYYRNRKTAVISIQVFGFHSLKPCTIKKRHCAGLLASLHECLRVEG